MVIQMPWALKTMWHDRLMLLVEDWIGGEPLERTDIYGIRVYQQGARLLSHVDRFETHAASLILNVAQEGTDEEHPWPVEIYDHSDHLHEVAMAPGDIVYYESARCLHARMQPLRSGAYANLFVHYRPKDDPNWFRKNNPPYAPERVTAAFHAREAEAWRIKQKEQQQQKQTQTQKEQQQKRPSRDGLSVVHMEPLKGAAALAQHWYDTRVVQWGGTGGGGPEGDSDGDFSDGDGSEDGSSGNNGRGLARSLGADGTDGGEAAQPPVPPRHGHRGGLDRKASAKASRGEEAPPHNEL